MQWTDTDIVLSEFGARTPYVLIVPIREVVLVNRIRGVAADSGLNRCWWVRHQYLRV